MLGSLGMFPFLWFVDLTFVHSLCQHLHQRNGKKIQAQSVVKEKVKMTPEVFYILGSSMEINQISFRNLGKVKYLRFTTFYTLICVSGKK